MSQFWSDIVHQLEPYVPGEQPKAAQLIKLNTNESPYGPGPAVLAALTEAVNDRLRLYPDPNSDLLKQAVADCYSVTRDQVFVGNGSDEVLAHVFQALLKRDKPLLFPDITYSFYPVYCRLYQIDYETIPLDEDFQIALEDYQRPNGGIIFPNPNAPTGRGLARAQIEALLQANQDSVVVVDEAYVDFGGESAVELIHRYPNLLVIQTLSKSRSLAGLRVGFAMGNAALIEGLERVKNSFNSYPIDRLAEVGAVASLADKNYFDEMRQRIIGTRERLAQQLTDLGFQVLPSQANFLFVQHPEYAAKALSAALRAESIIVRHFNLPRIDQFLRISIGTDEQCARLVAVLAERMPQLGTE